MINYNKSKVIGPNPFMVRNGHAPTHGSGTFYGLNITGIHEPAQATTGSTYGAEAASLMLGLDAPPTNIFRWKPCILLVADWPWATDEIGVAFDQSNLWGVRTRCCVAGLAGEGGDGGEVDWWTAVPRTLPSGFTFKGKRGSSGAEFDTLGAFPLYGPASYDYDFGSGLYAYNRYQITWREQRQIDGYGASATHTDYQWAPMNLSRLSLLFGAQSGWYTVGFGLGSEEYTIGHIGQIADFAELPHVGFRGGRLLVTLPGAGPYAPAGTLTAIVGYSETNTPADMSAITTAWSQDITTAATGPVAIGNCLAPPSGGPTARKYWHLILKRIVAVGNYTALNEGRVSPRTDIPLWFTSITGNRVAPGGIVP